MVDPSLYRTVAFGVLLTLAVTSCTPPPPTPAERSAQLTAEAIDMMMHTRPSEPPSVWSRAATLLEEAVALDSTNGVAYASLVLPNIMMPNFNERDAEEAEQKGRAAIERAMTLSPDSPDVLVANAIVLSLYDINYDAAGIALRRAIELDPDHQDAHREYGHWLGRTGNYEESLAAYNRALELDPGLIQAYNAKCNTLRYLRRLDEAETVARDALQLSTGNANSCLAAILGTRANYGELLEFAEAQLTLLPNDLNMKFAKAAALAGQDRHDEALALYRELKDPGGIGFAHALAGRADSAEVYIADLAERVQNGEWGWNWSVGDIHLALGHADAAATAFVAHHAAATNMEARGNLRAWLADSQDPRYASLRQHPRIQAIIQDGNS